MPVGKLAHGPHRPPWGPYTEGVHNTQHPMNTELIDELTQAGVPACEIAEIIAAMDALPNLGPLPSLADAALAASQAIIAESDARVARIDAHLGRCHDLLSELDDLLSDLA